MASYLEGDQQKLDKEKALTLNKHSKKELIEMYLRQSEELEVVKELAIKYLEDRAKLRREKKK